jgi:hypothetical protein
MYNKHHNMVKRVPNTISQFNSRFKRLCTPSAVYFVLSVFSLLAIFIQNLNNGNHRYCVGNYSCNVSNKVIVFAIKIIYVLFWTWVLDLICKAGYKGISWFLVLFPFIFFFVAIGLYMISN